MAEAAEAHRLLEAGVDNRQDRAAPLTRVVPVLIESRNDPSALVFRVLLVGKPLHTFPEAP